MHCYRFRGGLRRSHDLGHLYQRFDEQWVGVYYDHGAVCGRSDGVSGFTPDTSQTWYNVTVIYTIN